MPQSHKLLEPEPV